LAKPGRRFPAFTSFRRGHAVAFSGGEESADMALLLRIRYAFHEYEATQAKAGNEGI
jgi:hypothetical protein